MVYFNGDTGLIYSPAEPNMHYFFFQMKENLTPYYARDGCYVGCKCATCKCATDESSTDFYNPRFSRFVDSYEQLNW